MVLLIWREDIENDIYKLSPINDEIIKKANVQFKVKLPLAYIEILKVQNGGYIVDNSTIALNDSIRNNANCINIDHIMGIGTDIGILDTYNLIDEWGLPQNLVLLSGDGHTWVALDYRNVKEHPPVIYINTESDRIIEIATSFSEFLEKLISNKGIEIIQKCDNQKDKSKEKYYREIDDLILNGKPNDIDRFFTKIISTDKDVIRYMVEKMRKHNNPKVQFYLMLFLSECAEGNNKGILTNNYLFEVLNEISTSKNKDAKDLADYSLEEYKRRNNLQ
jgi:SMI1-KNR4 cell-wall